MCMVGKKKSDVPLPNCPAFCFVLDLHFVFSVDLCFVLSVDFIFLVSPTDL